MPNAQPIPVVPNKPPVRRTNRKLLGLLFLFFVVLLGVLFFNSSLSKIQQIQVEGHQILTQEQVIEATKIQIGGSFFDMNKRVINEAIAMLDPVESVNTHKIFPGLIRIVLKEFPLAALELSPDGTIKGILANGKSVPYRESVYTATLPILSGWKDERMKTQLSIVLSEMDKKFLNDVSEIMPAPTETYKDRIVIFTRSQFEVVTRITYMKEKLELLDNYIYELSSESSTQGRIIMLETNYWQPLPQSNTE